MYKFLHFNCLSNWMAFSIIYAVVNPVIGLIYALSINVNSLISLKRRVKLANKRKGALCNECPANISIRCIHSTLKIDWVSCE